MFRKNKQTEQITKLEEKLSALEQSITVETTQLTDINHSLDRLQRTVSEQGMSIEDMLEEWSERKSDDDSVKERFRECAQNEQQLLELFEAYQEQFRNMKRFATARDEAWAAQITLMEKNLEHYRQLCGISVIEECGVEVDYDLHEVIEAVDTDQPDLDRKIAHIYRCGYLYKGKVKRKAQVAAYRVSSREEDQSGTDTA
ncbi:MAG: nucleotide exchange factor GrpE [Lachnospiraceae bacterium]|nr:nucleotide exchange factor GrpE [Lachnospiraceae bacterium]